MISSDEAALVRAVHAAPDDHTPRLVYADWLDEFATTEQQRARSKWIRLTCHDHGKRSRVPTGERPRLPGEPDWVRKNAHCLWPLLFEFANTAERVRVGLGTGRVYFHGSWWVDSGDRDEQRLQAAVIGIKAERGVTAEVVFAFLHAARVAPLAAGDEPLADLAFLTLPERCFEFGSRAVYVHRRPFALRGLADVWEGIEADREYLDADSVKAVLPDAESPFGTRRAKALIDRSLTRWGRSRAANPLVI